MKKTDKRFFFIKVYRRQYQLLSKGDVSPPHVIYVING